MAIRVQARRMSTGHQHEHIARLRGVNDQTGAIEEGTRADWVVYVEGGGAAYVADSRGDVAYLGVRVSAWGNRYVQTYADGIWQDNLLALPTY